MNLNRNDQIIRSTEVHTELINRIFNLVSSSKSNYCLLFEVKIRSQVFNYLYLQKKYLDFKLVTFYTVKDIAFTTKANANFKFLIIVKF